ncbi:MAG: hypothetical protein HY459_04015 [Parcubacteria group bacterium]|nr:hypothetical protein [Parcubacteria group bacterium]
MKTKILTTFFIGIFLALPARAVELMSALEMPDSFKEKPLQDKNAIVGCGFEAQQTLDGVLDVFDLILSFDKNIGQAVSWIKRGGKPVPVWAGQHGADQAVDDLRSAMLVELEKLGIEDAKRLEVAGKVFHQSSPELRNVYKLKIEDRTGNTMISADYTLARRDIPQDPPVVEHSLKFGMAELEKITHSRLDWVAEQRSFQKLHAVLRTHFVGLVQRGLYTSARGAVDLAIQAMKMCDDNRADPWLRREEDQRVVFLGINREASLRELDQLSDDFEGQIAAFFGKTKELDAAPMKATIAKLPEIKAWFDAETEKTKLILAKIQILSDQFIALHSYQGERIRNIASWIYDASSKAQILFKTTGLGAAQLKGMMNAHLGRLNVAGSELRLASYVELEDIVRTLPPNPALGL